MATAAIVLSKTRQALITYLGALSTPLSTSNIYDGKNAGDKSLPCVVCEARTATEDPPGTGNFWVQAEVKVKTSAAVDAGSDAATVKAASEALSTAVFNALEQDDLADQLTAAVEDFTCQGVGEDKESVEDEEEDCFVESLKLKLYCCASDL